MGYANGRDQTVALNLEGNFFSPIKEVIKTNILQYQGGVELYNREQETMVKVDPVSLRKAKLEFKVSDGLLPSDKLVDGESLAMAFQAISQSPQVGQGFNIAPMFSYLMKTRGAKLQPFEKSPEQLAYEQAQAVWQQSIAAISENLGNMADTIDPEEFQKMLPPQPTPEQFGYTPGAPNVSLQNDGETVMDKYSQVTQQQAQAMQQAQAQAQQQGPAAGGSASGTPSGEGGEQGGQQ
jgi:hypothetical protein